MENLESITQLKLRPIVDRWLSCVDGAFRERQGFDDVVWMIREFYRGSLDFIWSEKFTKRYMGGKLTPRFKIGLNKTFEYVSLNIPGITWDHVTRIVKFEKPFEYGPDLIGLLAGVDPANPDPNAQQLLQQLHQQTLAQEARGDVAQFYQTKLFEKWLNYTPREMPDGTMVLHQERAAVDMLISGRGVLWPGKYKMPGSSRTLTGCEFDNQDNLLIDPDVRLRSKAKYIIRRCVDERRAVEKEYRLPAGALRKAVVTFDQRRAAHRNSENRIRRPGDDAQLGDSYDQVVYYKIWSKIGVGERLSGEGKNPIHGVLNRGGEDWIRGALDRRVGDYAYIVVAEGCPYPLNCPPELFERGTNQEVRDAFAWPTPFWLDGKWPFVAIDCYEREDMPYPIPPLAAALGPLIYLNIAMSNLANRVWSSSRDFIAILESAYKTIAPCFEKGEDLALIKVPQIHQEIDKIVTFLKQPPLTADQYTMLDRMMSEFISASGLAPTMYAMNTDGTQSRSAADANSKQSFAGVRPQFMRRKFDLGMAECADMEKIVAWRHVRANDVRLLVGDTGAAAWDALITNEPNPERILRSMRVTIDAQSGRRPNRDKDVANLKDLSPAIFPELSKHADATGDTGPLKGWVALIGEAMEQNVDPIMAMGPRVPMPPPPEVVEQQERLAQAEIAATEAKAQADVVKSQAAGQKAQADLTKTMVEAQLDQQRLAVQAEEIQLDKGARLVDMMLGEQERAAEAAAAGEQQALDLAATELKHAQTLTHSEEEHAQKMEQMQREANAKRLAKPKAKSTSKSKSGAK